MRLPLRIRKWEMGRALEIEYKKALRNVEQFRDLAKCREMDFPKNLNFIYVQNFTLLVAYYETSMCSITYSIKTDYTVRTLVYNYVASIKAYLNRKRKRILSKLWGSLQKEVQSIMEKYWKAGRKETFIDKVVGIRDVFEHEEISDLAFRKEIYSDKIIYILKYINDDFFDLAQKCMKELEAMNQEIEAYIESALNDLNLRDNCLFLNAFYRKYKGKAYTTLSPEESEAEKKYYDKKIESLC